MQLTIKNLAGEITEPEKRYIRERFLWLKEHLSGSSELTVGVIARVTKRSNQAYEIILHLVKHGQKRPIYVRTAGNDFRTAVDRAKDKIERIVIKRKERGWLRLRMPKFRLRRKK